MQKNDGDFRKEVAALESLLRAHGFDLVNLQEWIAGRTPLAAGEVLTEWLDGTESDEMRDFIARVLTQKQFTKAIPALLRAFRTARNDSTRWAIANAISHIGFGKSHWSEVLTLAADPSYGRGRQPLVNVLHRIELPETEAVLFALVNDADVGAFALRALSFVGSYSAYQFMKVLSPEGRSVLFKRTLETALPRLAARLQRGPN